MNKKQFYQDLEKSFPAATTNYSLIEHVSEWDAVEVPEYLTQELAMKIHTETE